MRPSTDYDRSRFRAKDVLGDAANFRPWLEGLIGQLVASDTKVSRNTLVQLICLFSSGLMDDAYKYEGTGIGGWALVIGIGDLNEQRTNRTKEL
jgi:hypothetical protein